MHWCNKQQLLKYTYIFRTLFSRRKPPTVQVFKRPDITVFSLFCTVLWIRRELSSLFLLHMGLVPLSRPLAVYSREAAGSDDSGDRGFQRSERRDVFLAGLSATTSNVLPYHDTLQQQQLTQPSAHPCGPFGAAFVPPPRPAEGCPPLLHLRLAFLPNQSVLLSPIQNRSLYLVLCFFSTVSERELVQLDYAVLAACKVIN